MTTSPESATLLAKLHASSPNQDLPTHTFSSSFEPSVATLTDLIDSTTALSQSFSVYNNIGFDDTRNLGQFRPLTGLAPTLHHSDQNDDVKQTIQALRDRQNQASYSEDVPFAPEKLPDWCIARLQELGASAGMQTFSEPDTNGSHRVLVALAGSRLVVDVILTTKPVVRVASVKISYAASEDAIQGIATLEAHLTSTVEAFLGEVQRKVEERNVQTARLLGLRFQEEMKYLMLLDTLADKAENSGGSGARWFLGADEMAKMGGDQLKKDALAISASLGAPRAPLDIFLTRGHALTLPFLVFSCVSFLVHITPRAYLTILRSKSASPINSTPLDTYIDIPEAHLRSCLAPHVEHPGLTMANLVLRPHSNTTGFQSVPTSQDALPDPGSGLGWILEFRGGGAFPGVVMSQTRMRAIESIVSHSQLPVYDLPIPGIDGSASGDPQLESWLHLLLRDHNIPYLPSFYTTVHQSPSNAYPPLRLRLAPPPEPGFVLEQVPVRRISEVSRVLDIVRDQAWLNAQITACKWVPEQGVGPNMNMNMSMNDAAGASMEELAAIMSGAFVPLEIPVNITLPKSPSPRIVISTPERAPTEGLVEIDVVHEPARERSVKVEVRGALDGREIGSGQGGFEEIVRRGGIMSLAGRIWASVDGPS